MQYFFYRFVAENFLVKESQDQIFVLHLDYNCANDDLSNLKRATKEQMLAHAKKSPYLNHVRTFFGVRQKKSLRDSGKFFFCWNVIEDLTD